MGRLLDAEHASMQQLLKVGLGGETSSDLRTMNIHQFGDGFNRLNPGNQDHIVIFKAHPPTETLPVKNLIEQWSQGLNGHLASIKRAFDPETRTLVINDIALK